MKKAKVLVLSLLVCVLGLLALPFGDVGEELWTNTYDSTQGNDYSYDVAVDSGGNVIVVGVVTAPTNYGENGYVIKYNAAGDTVLWSVEFDAGLIGGSGGADSRDGFFGVCVDSQDNVIIGGMKAVPYGPYPCNQIYYLVKYNSGGTFLWDEVWYVYGWDSIRDVCVDANDDIYVFGDDFGDWGATRGRWAILKYDKDGGAPVLGPLYHNLYGNEFVPDRCWGGVVDQEGNIIAVGAVGIYGVSGGITNDYDWHVRKYNSAGTLVWDDTYAGAANLFDYAFAVDVDSNGDVFVAGYTNIGTDNSTNQDYDWLVIKYDKDTGARLQTKTLRSGPGKSEAAYGLKVDFDDNVIVCGTKQAASGDSNRAIVRLRGTDLGIMDAQWWNSSDAEYCYKVDHNYGRIAIAERTNNGADWDMQATALFQEFNNLRLEMPADGSTLTDPPTLKWNPDGGESNAYSIEVAFKPGGPWRSTASNLGIIIWDNSWTCPTNVWNRIPTGVTTYWRVVGRDTKVTPPVYITSSETWTFVKN